MTEATGRTTQDEGARPAPSGQRASVRAGGPGLKRMLVLLLLVILGTQALWLFREPEPRQGTSVPVEGSAPGQSSPVEPPGSEPGNRDAGEIRQAATMIFLGRDHSLVRRSVGFAWTLDRLRSSAPYRLTPAQVEELRPLVQLLVEDARAERESILGIRAVLTPEQVAFLNSPDDPRAGDLAGSGGTDVLPSEEFKGLLQALRQRVAAAGGSGPPTGVAGPKVGGAGPDYGGGPYVPSGPGRNSAPALVSRWSDFLDRPPLLARWLAVMDSRPELSFGAEQSSQMVQLLERLIAAVERYDEVAGRFAAVLTDAQMAHVRAELQKRGMPDYVVVNVLMELLSPP